MSEERPLWSRSVLIQGINDLTHPVWGFLTGLVVTAVSTVGGALVLAPEQLVVVDPGPPQVVEPVSGVGDIVIGGLFGLGLGVAAILGFWLLYSGAIGPYRQRNALRVAIRQLAEDTAPPPLDLQVQCDSITVYQEYPNPWGVDGPIAIAITDATFVNRGVRNVELEVSIVFDYGAGEFYESHRPWTDVLKMRDAHGLKAWGSGWIRDYPLHLDAGGNSAHGKVAVVLTPLFGGFPDPWYQNASLRIRDLVSGEEMAVSIRKTNIIHPAADPTEASEA